MLSLPHGRILLIVGWLLIAAIVIGSLTPAGVDLRFHVSDKVRHLSSYLVLMLYFSLSFFSARCSRSCRALSPRRGTWT
jgi:hypothetical protein